MTRREFYRQVMVYQWRANRGLVLITAVWPLLVALNAWQRDWSAVILLCLLTMAMVVLLAADYVIDQLGTENTRLRYAFEKAFVERHRDDGGEGA